MLRTLFPSRVGHYKDAYDKYMAAIPDGPAKASGLALGKAAAAAHLERRASDGRAGTLAPYAAHGGAGRFQGKEPVNRYWPMMRPFSLTHMAQFRPPPPPALSSAQYAADFQEVKELGGIASTRRTPEQQETARFHSEPPLGYFTRNFGRFARTTGDPFEAARLMAAIHANYHDTISACLEAKYHYDTWRPQTAIPMADTDGNPGTVADPDWKPVYPTPNHPEYPAAHSCSAGSMGELLRRYYGTDKVTFTWDSKVSGTTPPIPIPTHWRKKARWRVSTAACISAMRRGPVRSWASWWPRGPCSTRSCRNGNRRAAIKHRQRIPAYKLDFQPHTRRAA